MLQHTQTHSKNDRGFVAIVILLMLSQAALLGILSTSYALAARNDLALTKEYRLMARYGLDSCVAWAVGKIKEDWKFEIADAYPHFKNHSCSARVSDMPSTDGPPLPGHVSKFIFVRNKFRNVEVSKDILVETDAEGNLIIL